MKYFINVLDPNQGSVYIKQFHREPGRIQVFQTLSCAYKRFPNYHFRIYEICEETSFHCVEAGKTKNLI